MKILFLVVGKTVKGYYKSAQGEYLKRLDRYCNIEYLELPILRNAAKLSGNLLKAKEGEQFLSKITSSDHLVLLDENGKEMSSRGFSKQVENWQVSGKKRVVILVGGAFGFGEEVYKRANQKISLSQMTFSHQMIRFIFLEQLYRAYSIIQNEPYHND